MNLKNWTVYLDLDGVIANWAKAIFKADNKECPKEIIDLDCYWAEEFISQERIAEIMASEDFWANIELYPWGKKLVKIIDSAPIKDWYFLTKSPDHQAGKNGKTKWVKKHFPEHLDKLIIVTGNKERYADENSLLIDDYDVNLEAWRGKGGIIFQWRELSEDLAHIAEYRLENLSANLTQAKSLV